ncbi:toxin [Paenibacillus nanensis]|uniref:Toxin n=1 Tax=Paenibacillus nanensis TaxID=393251 RepID=A0A3A1VHB8_9BACL|nr:SpvB/TcaC N-terminal domain-containing protein [Paenibacillus nanensis]RIX60328.1 toxin [Paenibacillus nanensis]
MSKNEPVKSKQEDWKSPLPSISFPKGGGAIRGLGEKAAVNAATGTFSFQIPISVTEARGNSTPNLSLSYDSGQGNGLFGLGWSMVIPSIVRKTDKGLPRYQDSEDSDTFLISGAEDLVPVGEPSRNGDYWVRRYRPRIEGLHARIERWDHAGTGRIHWRSISKDNVTSIYGDGDTSCIADAGCPGRIFQWLLTESFDEKGNVISFAYKQENEEGVPEARCGRAMSQRHVKQIRYGNRTPFQRDSWLFRVVFDYGEHDEQQPSVEERSPWLYRRDPFSQYRAGFEQRTQRLCRRILLFHQFEELEAEPYLVRSYDLQYEENAVASYLTAITQNGYRRGEDGLYRKKSMPPLTFTYSSTTLDCTIHRLPAPEQVHIEGQWVDLESEGLSGILTNQAEHWYYQRNLGEGRFGPAEQLGTQPSLIGIKQAKQQFMDLAGDGKCYWVQLHPQLSGYYERTNDGDWEPFAPFEANLQLDWNDPNLRFIDLNGDGHADLLLTQNDLFYCAYSQAVKGFSPLERLQAWPNEEQGPALLFSGAEESVFLSDMSGDGLTDIVRIRNGEVCYWPNLGYGRFGPKMTMENAPWFDHPELFTPKSLHLADLDGSGLTDLIYLGSGETRIWFNQSGNGWSEPERLPAIEPNAHVEIVDLLGTGTSCLVWRLPDQEDIRYMNPLRGQKPHLLTSLSNHIGAETRVEYASSTSFYLQDRANQTPWATRLPFPVYVVKKMEVYDHIRKTRLRSSYTYHHGYYDGVEREFRGFGRVEQLDAEEKQGSEGWDAYTPPVLTKSWYHTGAYVDQIQLSERYKREYFREPGLTDAAFETMLLQDTALPEGLTALETREACRALKGTMLRKEIYALDRQPNEIYPYTVEEQNAAVELLHPMANRKHAVFMVHPREKLVYHYERIPMDPRIQHEITWEVDAYGNVLKNAQVSYGRRLRDAALSAEEQAEQQKCRIIVTDHQYTNAVEQPDRYHTPLSYLAATFELSGALPGNGSRFTVEEVAEAYVEADEISYGAAPDDQLSKRCIEQVRTRYQRNDLSGALPWGQLESLALPYESCKLAFTDEWAAQIYGDRVHAAMLEEEGGYLYEPERKQWWIPSGRMVFPSNAAGSFYQPSGFTDPFGHTSFIEYDPYHLLTVQTIDPYQNISTAVYDYRVMQPILMTDPNGNRSAAIFDTLGMMVGSAVMGKETERIGDSLFGFEANLDEDTLSDAFQQPLLAARGLLLQATSRIIYDPFQYERTKHLENPLPNAVFTITRETHIHELPPDGESGLQYKFVYSDGFGREIQTKQFSGNEDGTGALTDERWLSSGWTEFNNKGKPVRKFEPYFSGHHQYEVNPAGVSQTLIYDPLGRVIVTIHPNHTYEKAVFSAWKQETWDVNDTLHPTQAYDPRYPDVLPDPSVSPVDDPDVGGIFRGLDEGLYSPTWYASNCTDAASPDQQRAARMAAQHASTPSTTYLDSLGRTFLTIVDNGIDPQGERQLYRTRAEHDIEGNLLRTIDASGRTAMRTDYNMLSHPMKQMSMEAGIRWLLQDAMGKPVRQWSEDGDGVRHTYDAVHRPIAKYVRKSGLEERMAELIVYGEWHPEAVSRNLRTRPFMHFDGAGMVEQLSYDFRSKPVEARRRFASDYRQEADWSSLAPLLSGINEVLELSAVYKLADSLLEEEAFRTRTRYDALERIIQVIPPDESVIEASYNPLSLMTQVTLRHHQSAEVTPIIHNITYDAKGQRETIEYGNGVTTAYLYDSLTFRLSRLKSLRGSDQAVLQDIRYTYDPVGNITSILDQAQQTIFFNNQIVHPKTEYQYDALYRLCMAGGREHIGQAAAPETTYNDAGRTRLLHPMDGQAMRTYTETYRYDEAGNLLELAHKASQGNWTRSYQYAEASLLEEERYSNRLSRTTVGAVADSYTYDSRGNMTKMPHLAEMVWNAQDRLERVNLGGGGTAYYQYDAGGKRVRKVIERLNGAKMKERYYLGELEIYREFAGDGSTVELERESLHLNDEHRRIALLETRTIGDDGTAARLMRYQLSNHLDSAALELDESAQLISYEEYYPYGGTAYQSVRNAVEVPFKRYRFTGKERDEETGFYDHGARYYAPWLGRWLSCDPAGFVDGTNLYAYVRGNPVKLNDPTGMAADPGKVVAQNHRFGTYVEKFVETALKEMDGFGGIQEVVKAGKGGGRLDFWLMKGHHVVGSLEVKALNLYSQTYKYGKGIRQAAARYKINSNLKQVVKHMKQMQARGNFNTLTGAPLKEDLLYVIRGTEKQVKEFQQLLTETVDKFNLKRGTDIKAAAFHLTDKKKGGLPRLPSGAGGARGGHTTVGGALTMLNVGISAVQIGKGVQQIRAGDKALGSVDIAEGVANLGLTGATGLVSSGTIAAGGGALAVLGATTAAGVGVGLAAESFRAAIKGEQTPVEKMDKALGTSVGDIYGGMQKSSLVPQAVKDVQKSMMDKAADAYYNLFLK